MGFAPLDACAPGARQAAAARQELQRRGWQRGRGSRGAAGKLDARLT